MILLRASRLRVRDSAVDTAWHEIIVAPILLYITQSFCVSDFAASLGCTPLQGPARQMIVESHFDVDPR